MSREEQVEFQQDRLGNEKKKLDTLRAQEGMIDGDDEGIVEVGSANAGLDEVTVLALPDHTDRAIVQTVEAYNSASSGDDTMTLLSLDLDSSGNVNDSTRRSVPIKVPTDSTEKFDYDGKPFEKAIGVSVEFEGYVGVSIISDRDESSENPST